MVLPLPIGLLRLQNTRQVGEKQSVGVLVNFQGMVPFMMVMRASISSLAQIGAASMVGPLPDTFGLVVVFAQPAMGINLNAVNKLQEVAGDGVGATPAIQEAI